LLGDHSEREPPDPIPNSEVKPLSADDSVAVCHAKVGNCQALISKTQDHCLGFFFAKIFNMEAMVSLAKYAFEISSGLTGGLALWLININ
jgi:hypothetical protein